MVQTIQTNDNLQVGNNQPVQERHTAAPEGLRQHGSCWREGSQRLEASQQQSDPVDSPI